jgi:hypothetical protein
MPLIECISGGVTTELGSESYAFQRDTEGRFVCNVQNLRHVECLLSIKEHYRRVDDVDQSPAASLVPDTDPIDDEHEEDDADEDDKDPVLEEAPGASQTGETLAQPGAGATPPKTEEAAIVPPVEKKAKAAAKKPAPKKSKKPKKPGASQTGEN